MSLILVCQALGIVAGVLAVILWATHIRTTIRRCRQGAFSTRKAFDKIFQTFCWMMFILSQMAVIFIWTW